MADSAKSSESNKVVEIFEKDEVPLYLAKYVAGLSKKTIKERGVFTFVLSGGSMIHDIRKLTEPPYIDALEWSKWHVFWVDERVVPTTHEDSNYKLAYDGFLSKVPIPRGNVHAINDELAAAGDAEAAADDYEARLKQLVECKVIAVSLVSGFPKFDLILLGLGLDCHVASLFPGHPLVEEDKKWVGFITNSPKPPPKRITFTFPVINSSDYIAMVVIGAASADSVHTALSDTDDDSEKLPAQLVFAEKEFKWFLDKEAASKLNILHAN